MDGERAATGDQADHAHGYERQVRLDAVWFEDQIARAVVLALFVPLIISSGGNAGSQATTLVIRAMALSEITARNLLTVIRRELSTGCALGILLAAIGCAHILLWQQLFGSYGEHAPAIAATVSMSLVGCCGAPSLDPCCRSFFEHSGSTRPALQRRSLPRWSMSRG